MTRSIAVLVALALVPTVLVQAAAPLFPAHVVLNEVMPNPVGTDFGREWVELYNPTPSAVDLTGWTLTDRDVQGGGSDVLDGVVVPAFGHAVVLLVAPRLANTGDELDLLAPDGVRVDSVTWGPDGMLAAPAEGASLARAYLVSEHGPALGGADEWHHETEPTPGAPNRTWL